MTELLTTSHEINITHCDSSPLLLHLCFECICTVVPQDRQTETEPLRSEFTGKGQGMTNFGTRLRRIDGKRGSSWWIAGSMDMLGADIYHIAIKFGRSF